jgi:xanthine dehydrogenase accessory factor
MDSIDLDTLRTAGEWVRSGHRAVLATVTRTWGSSPRPEGAMMVLRDDGWVRGSISGGCIEDDLIARAAELTSALNAPVVETYGVSAEEAHRFGLPCGGTIQIVLEPLREIGWLGALTGAIASRQLMARELTLATGEITLRPVDASATLQFDGERLTTIHGPRYRLLIIGAGSLSAFLAPIAVGLDYEVTVCDPRIEHTAQWQVPNVLVIGTMPDDAVMEMKLDARSAVLALTHDPKLDDLALMEALKSDAFYVGAIGSRRNTEKRKARLVEFDVSPEQLDKLHGPVGIHIGSRTPHEIAISILADLTAAKNGVTVPKESDIARAKQQLEARRAEFSASSTLHAQGHAA